MLFLLTLMLIACLMQISAPGALRTLRQNFRGKSAVSVRWLEIARLVEPTVHRLRFTYWRIRAFTCLREEESCLPILLLDSPARFRLQLRQGEYLVKPANLKTELSYFKRFDRVL